MAYIIQFTSSFTTAQKPSFVIDDYRVNGPINPATPTPAVNADNTVTNNTVATSLLIYGKHMPNWGEKLEENVIHVLENFCDATPPVSPTKGQKWFDSSNGRFMFYTGLEWASCDSIIANTTAPVNIINATNPFGATYSILLKPGQLWFDTTTNHLKIYDGSTWISASSNYVSKSGDTLNLNSNITFNGGEVLGLPNTPSVNNAASSKSYVDNQVATHASNYTLHLTTNQNTLLDNIESLYSALTATELGALDDFNTGGGSVQTQINNKLDKTTLTPQSVNSMVVFNDNITLGLNKDIILQSGGEVLGLPATPSATAASSKEYVDNNFLSINGGSLSGFLTLNANPTLALHATTKQYVDSAVTGGTVVASSVQFTPYGNISSTNVQLAIQNLEDLKFPYSGGTLGIGSNITFNGGEVLGLPAIPSGVSAAASKAYVDNRVPLITQNIEVSPGYVASNIGTVPSYIVGNNNLWVFSNGIKQIKTYAYDEVGILGSASTSITWQTTVSAGVIIEYMIF